jgi:hypothetical protein
MGQSLCGLPQNEKPLVFDTTRHELATVTPFNSMSGEILVYIMRLQQGS